MNVIELGPLRVGSLVWQSHANRALTIACKAPFTLQPGESPRLHVLNYAWRRWPPAGV